MPNCTVCKCPGHNRRTCTYLKEHFLRIITEELEVDDVNSPTYSVIKNYIYSSLNSRLQDAIDCEIEAEHILRKCNDLKRQFEPRHPGLLILDRLITIRENHRHRVLEDEEFIFDFETPPVIMPTTPTAELITPTSTPNSELIIPTTTPSDVPYAIYITNENIQENIPPITPNSPTDFTADFLPFTARRLFDQAIQDDTEWREILEEAAQQPMEFSFDADDVDDVDFIPFGPVSPEEAYEYVSAPRHYKRGYEYAKEINVDLRDVTNEDLFGELKECELCYDRNCSVKTGCGHDFCSVCVRKIINEKKDTTTAPSCSYCRKAFEKFTTNSPFTYAILCDYIEHMII
jgi:hypothetical protein